MHQHGSEQPTAGAGRSGGAVRMGHLFFPCATDRSLPRCGRHLRADHHAVAGHAAEEVEQQITVPLEVELNGVADLTHLRSVSLSGLSMITITSDDDITTFNARQEVLDRLQTVTLPTGVNPGIGPDYSPTGQIMFYTLTSANPKYDVMELKTLNDWSVLKQLKSVPNIRDVIPFGVAAPEYQVQVDPGQRVACGL